MNKRGQAENNNFKPAPFLNISLFIKGDNFLSISRGAGLDV
jgi:hypothetical protein